MPATTDALARVHDALPDDADIAALGHEFIGMFIEYRDVHGYDEEHAEAAAIREVIEGIRATEELRDQGYCQ